MLSCRDLLPPLVAIIHSRQRNVLVSAVLLLFRGIFDPSRDMKLQVCPSRSGFSEHTALFSGISPFLIANNGFGRRCLLPLSLAR